MFVKFCAFLLICVIFTSVNFSLNQTIHHSYTTYCLPPDLGIVYMFSVVFLCLLLLLNTHIVNDSNTPQNCVEF